MTDIAARLAAPFPLNAVSWRVGSTNKRAVEAKKTTQPKGIALAYLDARDVMERLDDVCGVDGWQCRYSHAETKTVCEIGVLIAGDWIWKADGAGDTDIEASKGALSDAFKRAGVRWGIGRYLYALPNRWVDLDDRWRITANSMSLLMGDLKRLSEGGAMPEQAASEVAPMSSAGAKRADRWDDVERALSNANSTDMLKEAVSVAYADVIAAWPEEWKQQLRDKYAERHLELRAREAA